MTDPVQPTTPVVAPVEAPASTPVTPANPQDTLSLWESIAALVGKFINDETAVGKAGKAGKWAALAVIVIAILTAIVAHPALFTALHWGAVVWVANVLLVLANNLLNPDVKNF